MKLTRSGYVISVDQEHKKELTVRPVVNTEFGIQPPPFKVFKTRGDTMCVPQFWAREKFGVPLEDTRPVPTHLRDGVCFKGKLREETHQIEAHKKAINQGHGILSLPCGFGKTTVALAIACTLGYRTMIIVHKEFLANQWKERIEQFCPGATVGIVQQSKIETNCDFVIAMLQSLSMKEYSFDDFDSIGTVIVDEAHHICAKVFSQSLFKLCPRHIYGLSATPVRKDGLTQVLHWFMGSTFFAVERKDQDQVEVRTHWYSCNMYKQPPPVNRTGKISLVQMITDIVEYSPRTEMILKIIKKNLKQKRKILVLSERRSHCEEIVSNFPVDIAGLYMGGISREELDKSAEKQLIVGTYTLAHEGLDIPTLDTLVMATPKSDIKQAVGRILRETPGKKNNPVIHDICDTWSMFIAMFHKRRRVYREGGFLVHGEEQEPEEKPVQLTSFSFVKV
jgi:superfamily II DNA or RNA helicase